MKLTNNLGLPAPIERFARTRTAAQASSRMTVTRLIGPAWQRQLMIKHWDETEQDVTDTLWALFGTAVHDVLQKHSSESELVERRILIQLDGQEIAGHPDILELASGTLSDWKVTSVWAAMLGDKPEWRAQLNLYAYGLRQAGVMVSGAQNVLLFRDWSATQAARSADYPQSPVMTLAQDLWPQAQTEAYIRERLAAHADPKPCSPEERWTKQAVFAVHKTGRKTAVKLLGTRAAAEEYALQDAKYYVVERPGVEVRCQNWCPVAKFCNQWTRGGEEDENED